MAETQNTGMTTFGIKEGGTRIKTFGLVKTYDGTNVTFCTNMDIKYVTTAQYENYLNLTRKYAAEQLGCTAFPELDKAMTTNIVDCPLVSISNVYAVSINSGFGCVKIYSLYPNSINNGYKIAKTITLTENGANVETYDLIKDYALAGPYTTGNDGKISSGEGTGQTVMDYITLRIKDAIETWNIKYKCGLNSAWEATKCFIYDATACPLVPEKQQVQIIVYFKRNSTDDGYLLQAKTANGIKVDAEIHVEFCTKRGVIGVGATINNGESESTAVNYPSIAIIDEFGIYSLAPNETENYKFTYIPII